ncbi:MAG: hypothetical protein NPMRD1_210007 [Nitrosopumilales archaeon]|nr:MAG: hypothetical protein NPMRD1_210007 [Nitrosopumilales archaeon]
MSVVLEQTSISSEKMIEILNIEQCFMPNMGDHIWTHQS